MSERQRPTPGPAIFNHLSLYHGFSKNTTGKPPLKRDVFVNIGYSSASALSGDWYEREQGTGIVAAAYIVPKVSIKRAAAAIPVPCSLPRRSPAPQFAGTLSCSGYRTPSVAFGDSSLKEGAFWRRRLFAPESPVRSRDCPQTQSVTRCRCRRRG